jgi:CubicO group peptidase (beta-lactamase class C family)
MNAAHLDRLTAVLAARGTQAFLVARYGKLVHEWYAPGRSAGQRHFSASLAKSLVGGTALLLALSDGRLAPDDLAANYIPAWRADPLKSRITIRHLAAHCSGLEDAETPGKGHFEQGGWKERFWRQEPDPFSIALNETPLLFEPGSRFDYSNPGFAMLGYVLTASLRGTQYASLDSLLRARLVQPLGISAEEWSIGYGKTFQVDGLELQATWGGGEFTPRAVARVGQLLLQNGQWGGQQLLDLAWLRKATQQPAGPLDSAGARPAPGLAWWSNAAGTWPYLPRDAFGGAGARHQLLLVVPSRGLVIVRNGEELGPGDFWESAARELFEPLADCFLDVQPGDGARAPVSPSLAIRSITFDPVTKIQRAAFDSDNWPVTWAAAQAASGGDLFTAYGDGRGFEPYTEHKLGLGLARISGQPASFKASNVRSASLENVGMGPHGIKASGLLDVAGRLYLLGRNAGNAQLAWSDDAGQSWTWADWKFTESFGYPTFLNFGPGYNGARDEYIYIYSHDGDSAYRPADCFVLARVPSWQLAERGAYEFFTGRDPAGQPYWSADIAQRGAIFTHPGRCLRSGISYNPQLKRYLWWQQVPAPSEDTRFAGGFGIYDAPEPWGPWTTAYFTSDWDTGPGEMGSFPVKWFSADGKTAWLVFSGYDYFSLRRCRIKTI